MTKQRIKSCGNVYRDMGFSKTEAEDLLRRSDLLIIIEEYIKRNAELTITGAARQVGISESRMCDFLDGFLGGRFRQFSPASAKKHG